MNIQIDTLSHISYTRVTHTQIKKQKTTTTDFTVFFPLSSYKPLLKTNQIYQLPKVQFTYCALYKWSQTYLLDLAASVQHYVCENLPILWDTVLEFIIIAVQYFIIRIQQNLFLHSATKQIDIQVVPSLGYSLKLQKLSHLQIFFFFPGYRVGFFQ